MRPPLVRCATHPLVVCASAIAGRASLPYICPYPTEIVVIAAATSFCYKGRPCYNGRPSLLQRAVGLGIAANNCCCFYQGTLVLLPWTMDIALLLLPSPPPPTLCSSACVLYGAHIKLYPSPRRFSFTKYSQSFSSHLTMAVCTKLLIILQCSPSSSSFATPTLGLSRPLARRTMRRADTSQTYP
jgi:hypothetical protein